MTMNVKITNAGTSGSKLSVQHRDNASAGIQVALLGTGESCDVDVYVGREFVLSEVHDAANPHPPAAEHARAPAHVPGETPAHPRTIAASHSSAPPAKYEPKEWPADPDAETKPEKHEPKKRGY